ncbi:MAG: hypothetical protein ACKVJ6_01075 [Flavobacteriales bacterium]|tara:strand:+ start:1675 stop:2019 length:345 start_codon:yes stop_codon:yes gene_type:complete
MKFEELDGFNKDLKKLLKKYRTLNSDLQVIRLLLEHDSVERPPFSFRIDNLNLDACVIKVKKIACRAMKSRGVNTGLRLVYAYFKDEKRIIFIELYHKGEKTQEDRKRIKKNFK